MCRSSPQPARLGTQGGAACGMGEGVGVSAGAGGELSLGNGKNCIALAGNKALLQSGSPATWDVLKLANSADWRLLLTSPFISEQMGIFPQVVVQALLLQQCACWSSARGLTKQESCQKLGRIGDVLFSSHGLFLSSSHLLPAALGHP